MSRNDREAGRIVGAPKLVTSPLGGIPAERTSGYASGESDWVWDHSYWIKPWLRWWNQRLDITIDADEVEVPGGSTSHDDFGLLVTEADLPSEFWDGLHFDDGRELRFTASDGYTLIPHDLVSINTVGQTLVAWVLVPEVFDAVGTLLYLYYDSPGAVAPPPSWAQAVWAGYAAAFHLDEASGNLLDATDNGHDLTNDGLEYGTTGQVGDCVTAVRANTDVASRDEAAVTAYPLALECWFRTPDDGVAGDAIWVGDKDVDNMYCTMIVGSSGNVYAHTVSGGSSGNAASTANWDNDVWHHAVAVFESAVLRRIYLDGALKDTDTTNLAMSNIDRLAIAARAQATIGSYWEGKLDEVRIWDTAPSAEWVETCHNNQKTGGPSTFYAVGAAETVPDGDYFEAGDWVWDQSWWDGPDKFGGRPHVPPARPWIWDHSSWDGDDIFQ